MIKTFEQFEESKPNYTTTIIKRKIPVRWFTNYHFAVPTHQLNDRLIYLSDGGNSKSISSKNVESVELIESDDYEEHKVKVKERLQYHRDEYHKKTKEMYPWMYK